MIIVRSPVRISLIGGGSDYNNYIRKYGIGASIGFAINKYVYISAKKLLPFFPYKSKFTYNEIEKVEHNNLVKHNAIWHTLCQLNMMEEALEINYFSDIPSNSALGSSSAFIVALVYALNTLNNNFPKIEDIINKSIEIENMYSIVGKQDATISAIGGFSYNHYYPKNETVICKNDYLAYKMEEYGLLFYLNETRNSSDIVSTYYGKLPYNDNQQKIFNYAEEAINMIMLNTFDIYRFGHFINLAWDCKKRISLNIITPKVRKIETDLFNKYISFRMLGGGGGGSIFILSEKNNHEEIIDYCQKQNCVYIPFKVDFDGCKIIENNT